MARITAFVLRSKDPLANQRFYDSIGIKMPLHSHDGPQHYGTIDPSAVVEIYQRSNNMPEAQIIIECDVTDTLHRLRQAKLLQFAKVQQKETLAHIRDPDGNMVTLMQEIADSAH